MPLIRRVRLALRGLGRADRPAAAAPALSPPPRLWVHGRVLSSAPLVIHGRRAGVGRPPYRKLGPAGVLAPYLAGRAATFLISTSWAWRAEDMEALGAQYRSYLAAHPRHELLFLASDARETALFARHGLAHRLCNHNQFADEAVFDIRPQVAKRYDAIYNAKMTPFKRHELAREIGSLALIYYVEGPSSRRHYGTVRSQLPQAHFANGTPDAGGGWIGPEGVAALLNASRVGLCLSAEEGAMKASIEYLLCGLPVVTTPSLGGRERYFDPEFVETVEPAPGAVAAAVRRQIARRHDPHRIRRATLDRIRHDRAEFAALMQGLYDRAGVDRRFADDWPRLRPHYMVDWFREPEAFLRDAGVLG